MFSSYTELRTPGIVHFGGDAHANALGIGTLVMKRPDGNTHYLQSALYVQELIVTLVTVLQLTKLKSTVLFDEDAAYAYRGDEHKLMLSATLMAESIYVVSICVTSGIAMFTHLRTMQVFWAAVWQSQS